jgi:hypothetical protein
LFTLRGANLEITSTELFDPSWLVGEPVGQVGYRPAWPASQPVSRYQYRRSLAMPVGSTAACAACSRLEAPMTSRAAQPPCWRETRRRGR